MTLLKKLENADDALLEAYAAAYAAGDSDISGSIAIHLADLRILAGLIKMRINKGTKGEGDEND